MALIVFPLVDGTFLVIPEDAPREIVSTLPVLIGGSIEHLRSVIDGQMKSLERAHGALHRDDEHHPIGDEPRLDGLTIEEWRDAARAAEKKLAEASR